MPGGEGQGASRRNLRKFTENSSEKELTRRNQGGNEKHPSQRKQHLRRFRRGPGAKTAEACRAPGPEARCSGLPRRRSLQPGAASPAAPEASSRRSPRPAVTGGRWRGSRGGAGGIQSPSDPAGERGRARRRPESQASAGACAARRARVRISGESA